MATNEAQIYGGITSCSSADPREVFQAAVKGGLIVKDGKDPFGDDLWILVG